MATQSKGKKTPAFRYFIFILFLCLFLFVFLISRLVGNIDAEVYDDYHQKTVFRTEHIRKTSSLKEYSAYTVWAYGAEYAMA